MDLLSKYDIVAGRHRKLLDFGRDPFGVPMEKIVSGTEAIVDGKKVILFGTNNYLGLTFDPDCIEAGVRALREQGTGTTGSRIANGTYAVHRDLEDEIASFIGYSSAMVFPTGYQANLGTIAGLAGPKDIIFLDADSHASIYDGCKLSGATLVRFRHNDPADLDRRLERVKDEDVGKLVIIESIYSMFGDVAPIDRFAAVTKKHGVSLLVDEAHSLGGFGPDGRGLTAEQGVLDKVDFITGTFSKSLGAIGGFVVSSHPKFETLRYCSRQFMFTASSSPSSLATVREAIRQIRNRPALRDRLWQNARQAHAGISSVGLEICADPSPIIAVRLPDEASAIAMWNGLLESGVYVNLAIPPGTPNGASLLRCSVSAAHTPEQIDEICEIFERVAGRVGLGHSVTESTSGAAAIA